MSYNIKDVAIVLPLIDSIKGSNIFLTLFTSFIVIGKLIIFPSSHVLITIDFPPQNQINFSNTSLKIQTNIIYFVKLEFLSFFLSFKFHQQ